MRKVLNVRSSLRVVLLVILLFFWALSQTYARDVILVWDANSDLNLYGYRLYYKIDSSGKRDLNFIPGTTESRAYDGGGLTWVGQPYDGEAVDSEFLIVRDQLPDPNMDPVKIHLSDLRDDQSYYFVVAAFDNDGIWSVSTREICVLASNSTETYDKGWAIADGDLAGFIILYNDPTNSDDTPTLGSSYLIPPLHEAHHNTNGVGVPCNLQPSGADYSLEGVKILIPCPGYSDVSGLDLYYYDDSRGDWFLAHDADDPPSIIQPDAAGWLKEGSRENLSGVIAIEVMHFSGVQAAMAAGSGGGGAAPIPTGGDSGCFIDALTGK